MQLEKHEANKILEKSTVLYTKEQLNTRITELAAAISADIKATNEIPTFLTVMNGGLFFSAELLSQIREPLTIDYIHASRYGDATFGSTHITWYRQPVADNIRGRHIYIVDDILDEGHTLAEIKRFILSIGAKTCKLITLIDKNIDKSKPVQADYVGLTAPNHFLFGYGMDIYEVYRQLPEIYMYNT
jgi:hypoxanthine phosphoribosyltransferase